MNERICIADKKPEAKSHNPVPQIRRKTEYSQSMNSPVDRIKFLQRTMGNQAVGRLIKSGALQAKLRIGHPGDIYEQEADRVAEQVMGMPDIGVQTKNYRIQRKCPKCGKRTQSWADEPFQPKVISGGVSEVASDMEGKIGALGGCGQTLPGSLRAFFEPRFGVDFSQVRVHTDAAASHLAQSMNARAFTVGRNVVFGAGQYAPGTMEGQRLIAHELTHAVQQEGLKSRTEKTQLRKEINAAYAEKHESGKNTGAVGMTRPMFHNLQDGTLQKAAPAVGIGALAGKCIIGAIIGALFDLGIQSALYGWRERTWRVWRLTVDYCSLIISAVLGCIGGAVAAKWLEPWLNSALGSRLGGIGGTLLGRILIFIANKLSIGVPRGLVKTLLKLGCVSRDQAETVAPGIGGEATAASTAPQIRSGEETHA